MVILRQNLQFNIKRQDEYRLCENETEIYNEVLQVLLQKWNFGQQKLLLKKITCVTKSFSKFALLSIENDMLYNLGAEDIISTLDR